VLWSAVTHRKLTQFDFFAEAYSSAATSQLAWVRILEVCPGGQIEQIMSWR